MSLTPEQTQALRALIEKNPALVERLQQSDDPAGAAAALAAAAGEAGLTIDAAALREHFEQGMSHTGSLSDEQLEAVAGGDIGGFIQMSILTFGIGCAAASLAYQSECINKIKPIPAGEFGPGS